MRIGLDVASITRVGALVERRPGFVDRVYTAGEQADCVGSPRRWASRWAAKEAVRKLAGSSGAAIPAFRDIEVVRGRGGAPALRIDGADSDIAISITDDAGVAVAVVASLDRDAFRIASPLTSPPPGLRLPDRHDDANKGSFGTLLVIAGSREYSGAPILAAMGGARGGAGLVRLCVPESIFQIVASRCLEVMAAPLPDHGSGALGPSALPALQRHLVGASAVVLGCGLGREPATEGSLADLLAVIRCPLVLDADALNIAAAQRIDLRGRAHPLVLTPHPGEMARLAGVSTATVQADRMGVARTQAMTSGATVILKGSHTIVAGPDGRVHVDDHSLVALATGGTGDVLAGLVGAMLAQRLPAFEAAVAAVTIHAEAGKMVQRARGRAGAIAGDLLDALPSAQEQLRRTLDRARDCAHGSDGDSR